jgi:hypothetical protein
MIRANTTLSDGGVHSASDGLLDRLGSQAAVEAVVPVLTPVLTVRSGAAASAPVRVGVNPLPGNGRSHPFDSYEQWPSD